MENIQNTKEVVVLAPISVAGGATATTTEVDTNGWDYATYLFISGVVGANGVATIKLQDGDVSGTLTDVTGGGLTALTSSDSGKISAAFVDLRYRKRYQNWVITNGATNATLMAMIVILSRGAQVGKDITTRNLLQQIFVS